MHCKLNRLFLSPWGQFSPKGQSLIQLFLGLFERNENSPIKSLFEQTLGLILARGSKSTFGNWTVLALIKVAKLDPKNTTAFYSPRRPLFLFLIYSVGVDIEWNLAHGAISETSLLRRYSEGFVRR